MNKDIEMEEKKLAEHLKGLSDEARKWQVIGLMCWLQGYEAGYQTALQEHDKK